MMVLRRVNLCKENTRMKKVLISDNISSKCVEILKEAGLEVDIKTGLKPEELKAIIGEYSGLVIRSATKVTAELIDAAVATQGRRQSRFGTR